MELKIGDIILVKGNGLISKIIKDVEHNQYCHTAVYVGNNLLIEAQGFEKTGYVSINKYKGQADVFRCNLPDRYRLRIASYLAKQVGTQYDWVLLFLEGIRYWSHNNKLLSKFYNEPYHSHICSTLATDAYQDIGIDLCPGIKYPSPGDLSKSKKLKKITSL